MELQDYFQSYEHYFWEWDNESGTGTGVFEAVTIQDGNTIAYEQYIMETLALLAEESLPPFGAFLLALAATNNEAQTSLDKIFSIVKNTFSIGMASSSYAWLEECRALLDKLTALPQAYKSGIKRRQVLQTLFSGCHNRISKDNAQALLNDYRLQKQNLAGCAEKLPPSYAVFQKDFRVISMLNAAFPDVETILKSVSSMPPLPEQVGEPDEKPLAKNLPDLVGELTINARTFAVGSLIKMLWYGLNIPMHHYASGRQPLGGVSDLTNKGDFSRLLLSEFANEDDVFMSRLANNEALYIEREVPPENDAFFRAILIDASLKNWGTPRVLAFATAIAIAKHPKTDIKCRLFAVGDTCTEVLYETVDDVIDGLDRLSPGLSSARGFEEFFESDIMAQSPEVFVISTPDAQRVPALQQMLSNYYTHIHYIIEPHFRGGLSFFRIANRARKLIQHIALPLDELWKNKPAAMYSKGSKAKKSGMATIEQYPVLYPLPQQEIARFYLNGLIYILTPSRNLYSTWVEEEPDDVYYDRLVKYKGAALVFEKLSIKSGGIHALGKAGNDLVLYSFYVKECLVSYLNLTTAEYHKTEFALPDGHEYRMVPMLADDNEQINGALLYVPELGVTHELKKTGNKLTTFEKFGVEDAEKQYVEQQHKMSRLAYKPGINILQNFSGVCIDSDEKLRLSNKHVLNLSENLNYPQHSSISITVDRSAYDDIKATYTNLGGGTGEFLFPDGSKLIKNSKGMITLVSSNPDIPEIYMPSSIEFSLALSTKNEFAGNTHFYNYEYLHQPKNISVEAFYEKYIQPYIQTIVNHES